MENRLPVTQSNKAAQHVTYRKPLRGTVPESRTRIHGITANFLSHLSRHSRGFAELVGGGPPGFLLDVQVVLGHLYVCMAHHALNGLHVHAKGLELGDVGVAAAMGREHPHALHRSYDTLKVAAKVAGIERLAGYVAVPFKPPCLLPEKYGTGTKVGRYGHVAYAGGGFGRADSGSTLDEIDSLADMNAGTVRFDVLGLLRQHFLGAHTRCQHEPYGMAHPIDGQVLHQQLDFLLRERLLALDRPFGLHLVGKSDGVLVD